MLLLPSDTGTGLAGGSKLLLVVATEMVGVGFGLAGCGVGVVGGIGAGMLVSGEGCAIVGSGVATGSAGVGVVVATLGAESPGCVIIRTVDSVRSWVVKLAVSHTYPVGDIPPPPV